MRILTIIAALSWTSLASFARLKDWRRVATRYDKCPKVFLSACSLAAVVMFWL